VVDCPAGAAPPVAGELGGAAAAGGVAGGVTADAGGVADVDVVVSVVEVVSVVAAWAAGSSVVVVGIVRSGLVRGMSGDSSLSEPQPARPTASMRMARRTRRRAGIAGR
jgi:hypothetical protein